jgi:hypothetical protein
MDEYSEKPRSTSRWNEHVVQPVRTFFIISTVAGAWLLAVWGAFVTR